MVTTRGAVLKGGSIRKGKIHCNIVCCVTGEYQASSIGALIIRVLLVLSPSHLLFSLIKGFHSLPQLFHPWKRITHSSKPLHLLQKVAYQPISLCHWWDLWIHFWTTDSKESTGTDQGGQDVEQVARCGNPSTEHFKIIDTSVQYKNQVNERYWGVGFKCWNY